ncbi:MAG: hypothetical protein ABSE73_17100 [Planctomycetota bacterium]
MSAKTPEELLDRHEAFLHCRPVERPLLGYWCGGYFPAEQFPQGTAQWGADRVLTPEDVSFAGFAGDYENLYRRHRDVDDDFFYAGSAYWGIPWAEAILGCPIVVAAANCRAEVLLGSAGVPPAPLELDGNRWFEALVRFTRELVAFADGRFPVCPPLLRGPGDCASAMLGGMEFITGFFDTPERMIQLLDHCARVRLAVLERLRAIIPAWHGTHAAGGYPSKVWCRKTVAYNQDDSAALLNPPLFREFLLPLERRMCRTAEVNFIHLHSSCRYPVDILLEDRSYDVLEVNIDHRGMGPPVRELLPLFRKIQAAGRPLLLWGEFSAEDWKLVHSELAPVGLSLQPFAPRP